MRTVGSGRRQRDCGIRYPDVWKHPPRGRDGYPVTRLRWSHSGIWLAPQLLGLWERRPCWGEILGRSAVPGSDRPDPAATAGCPVSTWRSDLIRRCRLSRDRLTHRSPGHGGGPRAWRSATAVWRSRGGLGLGGIGDGGVGDGGPRRAAHPAAVLTGLDCGSVVGTLGACPGPGVTARCRVVGAGVEQHRAGRWNRGGDNSGRVRRLAVDRFKFRPAISSWRIPGCRV